MATPAPAGAPRRSFEDAARQARLQAGGIAQVMEQRRDQRGLRWLEDLIQDLRYGVRTLRRAPVFTAVTIAIPGVDSVAASEMTPMSGGAGSAFLRVEGFDEPAHDRQRVSLNTVLQSRPHIRIDTSTPERAAAQPDQAKRV